MNRISLLRDQFKQAHEWLEATVGDVIAEDAHAIPPGVANPIGATYAHAVLAEDGVINGMLKGAAPMFAGDWSGKTGVSEPQMNQTLEWGRKVKVDLPALRQYAQAVYKNTDDYLAGLKDSDLDRIIDLTSAGLGKQSVAWVMSNVVLGHVHNMMGEISALKGIQSKKGYPF